ncbi:GNAT family N-acetyltransferase [Paenibacillus shunpengii]|uniref:GNAT family N-acetyltransferase n=1 Tax=Paenibacillus shunpengii TaxID=2054424 RepID=A0ABW5SKK1_9BACL|nr:MULTISPECIES: GNAT family N-acetyltransferase [unclassified Paenibacillus]GAK38943.1 N-acetyltransferase GCN5 [Paenibacillus sp. TCA20]SDW34014.1 N-acetylglutamate synthase, GNAT family [Paenibacillus sp. PDC88]
MIRLCSSVEMQEIYEIVNDASRAYKGIIPEDCYHEPYMPLDELQSEIESGVVFWGYELEGNLIGVMGIQDRGDVSLIRHAYVKTNSRQKGIGSMLLTHLLALTNKPVLIGTWADASWAIRFYNKHGFNRVSQEDKMRLLKTYWTVPDRQIETSVVLSNE